MRLPYPPKELSPNARGHWSKKAKAAKQYRADCFYMANLAKLPELQDGPIRVYLLLCPPDHRRRDADNALAGCKALLDGLADALKVNDSRFRPVFEMGEPVEHGAVYVTIGETK